MLSRLSTSSRLLRSPAALAATSSGAQAQQQQQQFRGQHHQHHHENGQNWIGMGLGALIGAGVVGGAAYHGFKEVEGQEAMHLLTLKAEEKVLDANEQEVLDKENRVRQFGTLDKIFEFFSTYQYIDNKGHKTILMSVKDFYNSVTPGSTLTHGTGQGNYTVVTDSDIGSPKLFENESVPIQDSILNKIQRNGLLTYTDFAFLLNILSTPRRYMDIAFHAFDVSADGNCEAKEFAHVMARICGYKGNPEELLCDKKSGLLTYLFGEKRNKVLTVNDFKRLQRELIREILFLEFTRYHPNEQYQTIQEVDFCKHLLYNAHIPARKKARMLKRVEKAFQHTQGVTFDEFKNFYYVLFGGSDLERAMFFLDTEKNGVTKDEFYDIAKWVTNRTISKHVVDVIFTLLDEDNDQHLSEFVHVMARVAGYKGDPHELLNDSKSGLLTYIFGPRRDKVLTSSEFKRIQRDLIRDVLFLEFTRYHVDEKHGTIEEKDFAAHLLYNAHMPAKKKKRLLKRVEKAYQHTQGVSFDEFKSFYYVLFGGADLERAMFFLNDEKNGVTKEEFASIAKWVANRDVSKHIIDVLYTLLDEDGDGRLSVKEFQPVLFYWRHSRGFQKAALQISLGNLKI